MMHSQNIHPGDKWERVSVQVYGPRQGACILLRLVDVDHQYFDIALHYGREENVNEFVFKLKEAVVGLSVENTEKED